MWEKLGKVYEKRSAELRNKYMLKVNNRSTRKKCEIYSKLTIKTPEPVSLSLTFN